MEVLKHVPFPVNLGQMVDEILLFTSARFHALVWIETLL